MPGTVFTMMRVSGCSGWPKYFASVKGFEKGCGEALGEIRKKLGRRSA